MNVGQVQVDLVGNDKQLLEAFRRSAAESKRTASSIGSDSAKIEADLGEVAAAAELLGGEFGQLAATGITSFQAIKQEIGKVTESLAALGPGVGIAIGALAGLSIAAGVLAVGMEGIKIVADAVVDGMEVQDVFVRLEASLRANGAAAGYTSKELADLANSLVTVTGREDEAILAGEAILTRYTRIGHEVFPRVTRAAIDLAQVTGQDLNTAFTTMGKIMDGDAKSLMSLKDAGVILLPEQKKALATMIEQNDIVGYQTLLLDVLEQKIGGTANAYAGTLAGKIAIARAEQSEFSESIASEVIPALEDSIQTIVESIGGWDALQGFVSWAGHAIGDQVRQLVYGVALAFHEWERNQAELELMSVHSMRVILDTMLQTVEGYLRLISLLPGFSSQAELAKSVENYRVETMGRLAVTERAALETALKHQQAIVKLIDSFNDHRQALEGTTVAYGKHRNALEDLNTGHDALGKKIFDLIEKQRLATIAAAERAQAESAGGHVLREAIEATAARAKGLEVANSLEGASAATKQAVASAIEALVRAEQGFASIGQQNRDLLAARVKIETDLAASAGRLAEATSGSSAETRRAQAAEEAYAQAFARGLENIPSYVAELTNLISSRLENAHALDAEIAASQVAARGAEELSKIDAELADAVTRTTNATIEYGIQQEIENRIKREGVAGDQIRIQIINLEVRALHMKRAAVKELTAAQKAYNDLQSRAELATAQANNPQTNPRLRQIENDWLEYLQRVGNGSIEAGKKLFRAWATEYGKTADEIKAKLAAIRDAELAESIQGRASIPLDRGSALALQYKRERAEIERLMRASVDEVHVTAEDGYAALHDLETEYWGTVLSEVGKFAQAAIQILGDLGVFADTVVADLPSSVQDTRASGRGQAASGAAGVAASQGGDINAWWELLSGLAKALTTRGGIHGTTTVTAYGAGSTFNTDSYYGREIKDHLDGIGRVISDALNGLVRELDGTLTDFNVRVTQKGQGWRVKIGSGFEYYFDNLDDAINYAVIGGLKKATLQGVDPQVRDVLEHSTATTFQELFENLQFAKYVADADLEPAARDLSDRVRKFFDEITRATQLGIQDTSGLVTDFIRGLEEQRNALLGIQEDPAERARRNIAAYNREIQIIAAKERAEEASLLVQRAKLSAEYEIVRAEGALGKTAIATKVAILRAEGEIAAAEIQIAESMGQALLAIDAALVGVRLVLANLPALITSAEEADALARLGRGSRGNREDKKERQKDIRDEAARFGGNDVRSTLLDVQGWLADFIKRVKELGLSAAETAKLIDEAREEAERRRREAIDKIRRDEITPYVGRDTSGARSRWAAELADMHKRYDQLRETHKETGIALWKINAAERERARLLGIEVQASLGIARANIYQELTDTAQSLNFLRTHAQELGLTVKDVGDIAQEVSTGKFLDIADQMAGVIKDEKLTAELAEMKYKIQKANWKMEIEMAHAKGVLLEAEYQRLTQIWGLLPDQLPANSNSSEGARESLRESMAERLRDAAQALSEAAKRWEESTRRLMDFRDSLLVSDLSPLSGPQQLEEARRQYADLLRRAQSGDVGARTEFEQTARTLLEQARANFGSGLPYAEEFSRVQADLNSLISARPASAQTPETAFVIASQPIVDRLGAAGPVASNVADTTRAVKDGADQTVVTLRDLNMNQGAKLDAIKDRIGSNETRMAAVVSSVDRLSGLVTQLLRRQVA